jgi:hypothetical protein
MISMPTVKPTSAYSDRLTLFGIYNNQPPDFLPSPLVTRTINSRLPTTTMTAKRTSAYLEMAIGLYSEVLLAFSAFLSETRAIFPFPVILAATVKPNSSCFVRQVEFGTLSIW